MNYAVLFLPVAETQLFALYIRAADKERVRLAAEGAERILARDPQSQGESRADETRRVWFYRPLCLRYVINPAARTVTVVDLLWVGV